MTLTTKLAVAMIALVAVTVSAIGWLNYRSLEQALLPRVLDRIESQSRLVAADLEAYVAGARGDVASLKSGAALDGLIAPARPKASIPSMAFPKRPGASASPPVSRLSWKPSRPMPISA